jgi:hypothetical protein
MVACDFSQFAAVSTGKSANFRADSVRSTRPFFQASSPSISIEMRRLFLIFTNAS